MPSSKTDTGIRLPQNDDQTRRLRSTTQAQKAASRLQDVSLSGRTRAHAAADPTSSWTPEEMFESTVNQYSDPIPDRYSFTDGARMERGAYGNDEADAFEAANNEFD
ncbi:hypothetical protein ASPACDRAFT_58930 [Aspergillus aculeatus ATCC 16872]|uniref:Uncharacterized protein n=1 Tax=Aspergillus aculeatus (strain ATCC 16872 / CBS 172.66 / WB 5094) TaxID=690307 RepID=A0A1L9WYA6_ASPA1|nr:uncharacterized protein ASPACDRAFT_58930 [Aspergillus aculeatus ATCC 16872]OJK01200.1 hypothetical protein ASPACDRAFT_58930 [Aspergillus aculeatus ATCC 16872]